MIRFQRVFFTRPLDIGASWDETFCLKTFGGVLVLCCWELLHTCHADYLMISCKKGGQLVDHEVVGKWIAESHPIQMFLDKKLSAQDRSHEIQQSILITLNNVSWLKNQRPMSPKRSKKDFNEHASSETVGEGKRGNATCLTFLNPFGQSKPCMYISYFQVISNHF